MGFLCHLLIYQGCTYIYGTQRAKVVIHALPRVANPVNPILCLLLLVGNPCLTYENHSIGTIKRDGRTACLDIQQHDVFISRLVESVDNPPPVVNRRASGYGCAQRLLSLEVLLQAFPE